MKNLKHVQIEREEKRAAIKSIDEHEWSDEGIYQVNNHNGYCGGYLVILQEDGETTLNDEDLAVIANVRGFDLVKRGDTNE